MINYFKKLFSRSKETELKECQHDQPVEVFLKEAYGTRRLEQDTLTAQNAIKRHKEALQQRRYTDTLPKATPASKTAYKGSNPLPYRTKPEPPKNPPKVEPCRAHAQASDDFLTGLVVGAVVESLVDSFISSSSSSDSSPSIDSGGGTFDGGGASGDW